MNHSRVSRTDALLRKMEGRGVLTKTGAAWFKLATDPFHDIPVTDCEGWPDRVPSPSIVRLVKKSVAITRPDTFITSQWSFMVQQWPFLNEVEFNYRTRHNNIIDSAALGDGVVHGGIEVMCLDTGSPSRTSGTYFNMDKTAQYRVPLGKNYSKGLTRIIGVGYEIHDDTAEIYKQGHCYHARQSNYSMQESNWQLVSSGASSTTWATLTPLRPILADPAEMMLNPDTVDWSAKEGCYCVGTFNDGNVPRYVGFTQPLVYNNANPLETDEEENTVATPATSGVWTPIVSSVGIPAPAANGSYGPAIKIENLDQSCSMFTGLNPLGSYTLTVHYIVECFPSIAEPDMLPLARPSAKYDPVAIEMYVHAIRKMPVAVVVGDNYDGQWWADVVKVATSALAPAAALFGFPEFTPFIAGGGKLIENALRPPLPPVPQQSLFKAAALPPVPARDNVAYQKQVISSQQEAARRRKQANRDRQLAQMQKKNNSKK